MKSQPSIIIVLLRQPRRDDPQEARTDPLYEFGSFGLTGCHGSNLLHDTKASGSRLAFAQNGPDGFRLVMLTPPIVIQTHLRRREAVWSPGGMPLRYERAPLLIDNAGNSHVDGLVKEVGHVNRSTPVGRFSSAFRSRKAPVEDKVARSLVEVWEGVSRADDARAGKYWDALPYMPRKPDENRNRTYERLHRDAESPPGGLQKSGRRGC
jgi:hypothetical protein